MDYEKKYKEALDRARIWKYKSGMPKDKQGILDDILPDLKEYEDEKIREVLIWYFNRYKEQEESGITTFYGMPTDNILAWLEKQGDTDKASYDIAEKEKYDFVNGQFIVCRKSFNEFEENKSYWFEYIGNDTYIGRSDNILNKKFHITPRQLYCLFIQQHSPKENNVNEETNAPTGCGKYIDECLNEAARHFFSEGEDKYSVADLFYAGVRCGQSCLEKQGEEGTDPRCKYLYELLTADDIHQMAMNDNMVQEAKTKAINALSELGIGKLLGLKKQDEQKPTDNVEPKFKNGKWIVWLNKCYKVNDNGCGYELIDQNGLSTSLEYGTVDERAHFWTIQDAKDGDVLVTPNKNIFIFKNIKDTAIYDYCGIYFGEFRSEESCVNGIIWGELPNDYLPATKEQRDTLMKAMADAGWEFDFEKKELKEIEQKPIMFNNDPLIDSALNNYCCKQYNALHKVNGGFLSFARLQHLAMDIYGWCRGRIEPTRAWSEEDEIGLADALWCCKQAASIAKDENDMGNARYAEEWLKSLKDRVQSQPKQEWSVEDMSKIQRICKYLDEAKKYYADITEVRECIDWLKSLKERIGG